MKYVYSDIADREADEVFAMSKLTRKYADKSLFDKDFGEFIYFSTSFEGHGPRIKFYGGTKETSSTRKAPTLSFGVDTLGKVILQPWMNKKNCPNAFDNDYIEDLENTVKKIQSVLLLVWFLKLDEADALKYFEGDRTWEDLLLDIECPEGKEIELFRCKNLEDLHKFCKKYSMYEF